MCEIDFSILITTKNRVKDLQLTLASLVGQIEFKSADVLVVDDASTDETRNLLKQYVGNVTCIFNDTPKGYLYNRNKLLNLTTSTFSISLDDDAHFVTENPFCIIEQEFEKQPDCGVIAFRVYWGKDLPVDLVTNAVVKPVNAFVGCGHAWRMEAWQDIPDYPEWFEFYGEEQFASMQLFKKGWKIHYVPDILVHHRVDLKTRKADMDFIKRQRNSLSSGWYIMFLCYPWYVIPRRFLYSLWIQLKNKTFKGNWGASKAMGLALWDVLRHSPRFFTNIYRLTGTQFKDYCNLDAVPVYWGAEN